jgi:F0F1-type ATP synthase epsilon subunit
MQKAIKLKKLIKENEVKPTKVIDINTYTKEKLDIDLTKCEKAIAKLEKLISNHDDQLKLTQIELEQLKLELSQLNDLKNYVA